MNPPIKVLAFGLAACSLLLVMVALASAGSAADIDLELTDATNIKTIEGSDPVQFNFTIGYTGANLSAEVRAEVLDATGSWTVILSAVTSTDVYLGTNETDVLLLKDEVGSLTLAFKPFTQLLNQTYWFEVRTFLVENDTQVDSVWVAIIVGHMAGAHLEIHDPPPDMRFEAIPPSTVSTTLTLYNTGNAPDRFRMSGTSSLADQGWTLEFRSGVNETYVTEEIEPDPDMQHPYNITLSVKLPGGVKAGVESTVELKTRSVFDPALPIPSVTLTVVAMQYFNFNVYIKGPDAKAAGPGEEVSFELRINNQGNGPDIFSLEAVFDPVLNPGFVAYTTPENITLGPIENGTVTFTVQVPPDATKGPHTLHVEISSTSPELSPITKTVKVEVFQVFGIELTCEDPEQSVAPGNWIDYLITARNTGNGLDSFVVGYVMGVPEPWTTYTQPSEFSLLQNQSTSFSYRVIVPAFMNEAPLTRYTFTIIVESTKGDVEEDIEVTVVLEAFKRIEWIHNARVLTSPSNKAAQIGSVRPRPVIDLLNGTTASVVLGVENFGNVMDTVTIEMDDYYEVADVQVSPTSFDIDRDENHEVIVTITASRDGGRTGTFNLILKAYSSDEALDVRSVFIDYVIIPVYTDDDFDGLDYGDRFDDDYAFSFTATERGGEVLESRGRKDRSTFVDIIHLNAANRDEVGIIEVTLTIADDVLDDERTEYWVYFVTDHHRQSGPLLRPGIHQDGAFAWTFSDLEETLLGLWYTNGEWGSTVPVQGMEVSVSGDTITYAVPSRELRAAGLDSGSEFAIYAYAHTMVESVDGEYKMRVDWDSAGRGAAEPPADFTNKPEDSPMPSSLVLLALVLAAVVSVVITRRRRDGPQ